MEKLGNERSRGISATALRTWGILFLLAGIAGRSIIQNQLLNLGDTTNQQLLEAMQSSEKFMILATAALVLQAVETCAAPVFCVLLVEGFRHTRDLKKYFLRVLGVALISEIPYNLAMHGQAWELSSRNPVLSMVLCLIVLYFYQRYGQKSLGNMAIKTVVTVAAVLWAGMLRVEAGVCCLILTGTMWLCREKVHFRTFAGCIAAAICSAFSPFYLAAPMGFMAVHFYNGEGGAENRVINYVAYPAVLVIAAAAAKFLF